MGWICEIYVVSITKYVTYVEFILVFVDLVYYYGHSSVYIIYYDW